MGSPSQAEDRIVLSYHDALLKQSDVALLDGRHWLNDQIISFFFEYMSRDVHQDNESLLFVSPEVTQCLKMVSSAEVEMFLGPVNAHEKMVIFFALNDQAQNAAGGSHWSLLLYYKPMATFYHFDSATPSNHHVAESMMDKLKPFLTSPGSVAILQEAKCLQQDNSYDCGVHVIAQTEHLAKQIAKTGELHLDTIKLIPRQIITHKREHLLSLIEELAEKN